MADETVKVCYFDPDAAKRKCNEIPKPVVYTQPGCPYCASAKGQLRGLGVPFKEVSVTSKEQLGELVSVTGQTGTPVVVVGKKTVVGYYPKRIERALGIKRRR